MAKAEKTVLMPARIPSGCAPSTAILKRTKYREAYALSPGVGAWRVAARKGAPAGRGHIVALSNNAIVCECRAAATGAWCSHAVVVWRIIHDIPYDAWRWSREYRSYETVEIFFLIKMSSKAYIPWDGHRG